MTSITVISDLHLGDGSKSDDFELSDALFLDFLISLANNNSLVIINGDLFELWNTETLFSYHNQFKKVLSAHQNMCEAILELQLKGKVILISGNHDNYVRKNNLIPNILTEYLHEENGMKLYFSHGHQADIFNSTYTFIGRFVSFICGKLEKIGLKNVDVWVGKIQSWLNEKVRFKDCYSETAKELMDYHGYNLVCFGHTHSALVSYSKSGIYVNSGSLCNKKHLVEYSEILIDSEIQVRQKTKILK